MRLSAPTIAVSEYVALRLPRPEVVVTLFVTGPCDRRTTKRLIGESDLNTVGNP